MTIVVDLGQTKQNTNISASTKVAAGTNLHIGPRRHSVTCLATDACLTADPGVPTLIAAWSHTFMEIDREIISTVISFSSAISFKRSSCQF